MQPERKTRHEYAADFNTSVDYVRFWGELLSSQRDQVRAMFADAGDYADWVYYLGTDWRVLARRRL